MDRPRVRMQSWAAFVVAGLLAMLSVAVLMAQGNEKTEKEAREFLASALREELLHGFAKTPLPLPPHDSVTVRRHEHDLGITKVVFIETQGVRLKAEARFVDADKNLKVEIHKLKRVKEDRLEFTIEMSAPLVATAEGSYFPSVPRSTIEIQGGLDVAGMIRVTGECTAVLRHVGAQTELAIDSKSNLRIDDLKVTRMNIRKLGPVGGDAARILGGLLEGMVKREVQNERANLEASANAALAKATARPKVNAVLLQLVLPDPEGD